jgi:glutamate racemase
VPLIEAGNLELPELRQAASGYLAPLLKAGVDTIVLGCTHYPALRPLLSSLLPPDVQLVDPAVATGHRLGPLLASLGESPEAERAAEPVLSIPERTTYCVTGSAEAFAKAAATWLGQRPTVHGVNLQSPARIR